MHYEGMIYRPPSEAYSLILQVTVGCAHNSCTFCTMYKDKKFHIKSMKEIEADIRESAFYYANRKIRIFLADGDALALSTDKLIEIMKLLTPPQVAEEMQLFLSNVDSEGTVFRSNHASNYISLAGNLNKDIPMMLSQIENAKKIGEFKNDSYRLL